MNFIPGKIVLIILVIMFLNMYEMSGQFSLGASFGLQIPGRQDLKFRFYENNELIHNIRTTYVQTNITSMSNIQASYWSGKFGVRFDLYSWEHISTAKEFQTEERPPFFDVEQSRDALLLSLMRRFNFPFKNEDPETFDSYYSFVGIGIGEALTDVEQGRNQWRAGFQVFYGVSFPITSKLRLLGEIKLLLTRDADTTCE